MLRKQGLIPGNDGGKRTHLLGVQVPLYRSLLEVDVEGHRVGDAQLGLDRRTSNRSTAAVGLERVGLPVGGANSDDRSAVSGHHETTIGLRMFLEYGTDAVPEDVDRLPVDGCPHTPHLPR